MMIIVEAEIAHLHDVLLMIEVLFFHYLIAYLLTIFPQRVVIIVMIVVAIPVTMTYIAVMSQGVRIPDETTVVGMNRAAMIAARSHDAMIAIEEMSVVMNRAETMIVGNRVETTATVTGIATTMIVTDTEIATIVTDTEIMMTGTERGTGREDARLLARSTKPTRRSLVSMLTKPRPPRSCLETMILTSCL